MTGNQRGNPLRRPESIPRNHGHRAGSGIVSQKSFLSYYKIRDFAGLLPTRRQDETTGAFAAGGRSHGPSRGRTTARRRSASMSLSQALQSASLTDPGRVRDHNEDCIESRPEMGLFVLADGMGGYNAGEVASGMATSLISDGLQEAWNAGDVARMGRDEAKAASERLVGEQIARANAAIFTTSQNNPECAGMGTTLVVCLFYDNFLSVAHIGDSRLYPLRGDTMSQGTPE